MPRTRPQHVHRETSRHGKTVWYVRVGHGPRIRLPVGPYQEGFDEAYKAALSGSQPGSAPAKAGSGSISWAFDLYRGSSSWHGLSNATRRQRECIFRQIVDAVGREPLERLDKAAIVSGRDRRRSTPAQAKHFLTALRGFFAWAVDAGIVAVNQTDGVKTPKQQTGEGFAVWHQEDARLYEEKWPLGTRQRLAFDVFRYTGLRRGDAARLGPQHVRDGVIAIKTEKTGEWVTIRVIPALQRSLDAGPTGTETFIATKLGRPMTKESLGNMFRQWSNEAGVNDKSAHGIRKLAATTMAEAGATVAELESVFGWSGGKMASLYTRSADRSKLGLSASHKLAGAIEDDE